MVVSNLTCSLVKKKGKILMVDRPQTNDARRPVEEGRCRLLGVYRGDSEKWIKA
jgi:hypothetical protein